MNELEKELRTQIEIYFDKKLKHAKLDEELKDKLWEMVDNAIEDVQGIVWETDKDIDNEIEESEIDGLPTRDEMIKAYDDARNEELWREYQKWN